MHGQYDIPLNGTGISQAKNVATALSSHHFDLCICSPLSRAKTTALHILRYHRATPIVYDDRLKELNKGLLEGKHLNSEKILASENSALLNKFHIESKTDFYQRVKNLVEEIERVHSGKNILIVAHSGTIKMLMFAFEPPSIALHKAYYQIRVKNCVPYQIPHTKTKEHEMKIGFFPMVADILHCGHVLALEEAKKHCDYLVVGLHCKPNYKVPKQSIFERYMQLRSVKWVDEVVPYEDVERDADLFTSLDYQVYFLGEDHKSHAWEMHDVIEAAGKKIIYLKRQHNYSSTRIKNACKS